MKEILQYLFSYNTLNYEEAKSIMLQIPQGVFNDAEITSFITVMMMRSIRIEELRGFSDALIEMAHPINLGTRDLVDIVGTGGDGKNTFNISTLACFVVAGAGQKVAKHGNYGSSSVSGSSNVMAHMGYEFTNDEAALQRQLSEANICFMHAPKFHPSLGKVAPIRKNLGFRTFFNMVGPLVNPAKPKHSMLGVFNSEMGRIYNYLLQEREEHFMIVHSLEGYDEISLTGESVITTEKGTKLLNPQEFLSQKVKAEELYGGNTTEEAAQIFKNILEGKGTKAQNEVVITNAALALENTNKFGDFATCRAMAEESLMNGKALQSLQQLIKNQ